MGKTAQAIIEDRIRRAEDTMITVAVDELVENIDDMPVVGLGLRFVQDSARSVIQREVKQRVEPDLREHTDAHLAYIHDAVETSAADALAKHEDRLIATNPLWTMLEADEETRAAVREELMEHSRETADTFAAWIDEADGREFNSYVDLALFLGKEPDDVGGTIRRMLHYVDMLDTYRDVLNPGVYNPVLERDSIRTWFMDNLIAGLETGREGVVDHIARGIEEGEPS